MTLSIQDQQRLASFRAIVEASNKKLDKEIEEAGGEEAWREKKWSEKVEISTEPDPIRDRTIVSASL